MFWKKCTAILLALTVSATMFPITAFAAEEEIIVEEAAEEEDSLQSGDEETAEEVPLQSDDADTAGKAAAEEADSAPAAEASEDTYFGTIGTGISWSYSRATRTLDVSGGANADWGDANFLNNSPWDDFEYYIDTLNVTGNITEIPDWFCTLCISLKTIYLTESITKLGAFCFENTDIENTDFLLNTNVTELGMGCFSECDNLTKVTIPASVEDIERDAFERCENLTEVEFEGSDKNLSIDSSAFSRCNNLKKFIPNDRSGMSLGAYGELIDTYSYEWDDEINKEVMFVPCDVTEYTIPDGITDTWGDAFTNCTRLKTFTIPKEYKGSVARVYNDVLTEFIVEKGNPKYSVDEEGVLFSTSSKFSGAKNLEQYPSGREDPSYSVASNVVYISPSAFTTYGTRKLRDLYLTKDVEIDRQIAYSDDQIHELTLHGYEDSDAYKYYMKWKSNDKLAWKSLGPADNYIELYDNYRSKHYIYPAKSVYQKMSKNKPTKSGYTFVCWDIDYYENYYSDHKKVELTENLDVTKYMTTRDYWSKVGNEYRRIVGSLTVTPRWKKVKATKKITKAKITVADGTFSNYGEVKPKVTVKYGSKTLKSGTDYKLTWSNNTAVTSKAKVKISGKGDYAGSVTKTFKIKKRSIASTPVHLYMKTTSCTYDGKAKKPKFTLYYENTVLQPKTDYKYSYKNNVKAGTGVITIKGVGNYNGSREKKFTISKESQPIKYTSSISKTYKEIGKKYSLGVKGTREFAKVTYTTDNKKVAVVSSLGIVTLKGTGTAKIKIVCAATKNYKKTTKTVSVIVKAKPSIKASVTPKKFAYGQKGNMKVTTNSSGKITFASADKKIVEIGKTTGEMTAKKPGKTKVTVSVAEDKTHVKGSVQVTVNVQKGQQIINASDIQKLVSDGEFDIGATLVQGNGKLSYQSSNLSILTVDSNGHAKILSEGKVTVSITASGTSYYEKGSRTITVNIEKFKKRMTPPVEGEESYKYYELAKSILKVEYPNCTIYALGRAMEIRESTESLPFIVSRHSNAGYWMDNNNSAPNPLPTGLTPKVGAIAVWKNNGAGHVAVVEDVLPDGTVYYSQSNGGGFTWNVQEVYPGSISNNEFHYEKKDIWGKDLVFQGYIYLLDN